MRWGDYSLNWARPLKSILAVFDNKNLSFQFHHLKCSNTTFTDKEFEDKKKIFKDFKSYQSFFNQSGIIINHNLNKKDDWEHFERCFNRLEIIKKNKIRTLFCLFFHPKYSDDGDVSFKDIQRVSNYLKEHYNCHLLICRFLYINNDFKWKKIISNEELTFIHVNNSSWEFELNKDVLNEIFSLGTRLISPNMFEFLLFKVLLIGKLLSSFSLSTVASFISRNSSISLISFFIFIFSF